jgi:hypothetical protein
MFLSKVNELNGPPPPDPGACCDDLMATVILLSQTSALNCIAGPFIYSYHDFPGTQPTW